jgi:hypothetical protein
MASLPQGSFPTMITPFKQDGAIDWPRVDGVFIIYLLAHFKLSLNGTFRMAAPEYFLSVSQVKCIM